MGNSMSKQIVTIQVQVEMPTVERESGESYSRYLQRLDHIARQLVKDAVAADPRVQRSRFPTPSEMVQADGPMPHLYVEVR